MSIVYNEVEESSVICKTITLDAIFQKFNHDGKDRVVIKLDIEGAEIQALKGASDILMHEPLIIYEDHGKDRNSTISRYISEELGYEIYAIVNNEHYLCTIAL